MERVIVFDNGGKTYDRYTIIDTETTDMWGASDNPYHPLGFGQYSGNIVTDYRRTLEDYIQEADDNKDWLGVRVDINSLPEKVQQYINWIKE